MTFKHSGDWGDIIYSLPTMRAMGGGKLVFGVCRKTRQVLGAGSLDVIAPLLLLQSYIESVSMMSGEVDFSDLDLWREKSEFLYAHGKTLAEYHLESFGLTKKETETRWLEPVDPVREAKVIINRTERYRNPLFPWREVVDKYMDDAAFIGFPNEHEEFCRDYGKIRYIETRNFLDAARVMSGSELFIGNQSCCFAIAEGLKLNVIQESLNHAPDCIFKRPNARHVAGDYLELPDL